MTIIRATLEVMLIAFFVSVLLMWAVVLGHAQTAQTFCSGGVCTTYGSGRVCQTFCSGGICNTYCN
jgi:hypothetical protein